MGVTRHSNGQYTFECDKRDSLPDVVFTLSGSNFTIGPEDYIMKYEGHCISAFMGVDMLTPAGPLAVLGAVFLRKWYSFFDLGDNIIGLAKAKPKVICV
jgi:saccharopepsin